MVRQRFRLGLGRLVHRVSTALIAMVLTASLTGVVAACASSAHSDTHSPNQGAAGNTAVIPGASIGSSGTLGPSTPVVAPTEGSPLRKSILDGIRDSRSDQHLRFVVIALVSQGDVALANVKATREADPTESFGHEFFYLVRDSTGTWVVRDQMDATDIDAKGVLQRWPGTTRELIQAFEAGKEAS